MKTTKAKIVNAADRLLESKRKNVARLRQEIANQRAECEERVARIEARIRVALVLISALEKGTLKP